MQNNNFESIVSRLQSGIVGDFPGGVHPDDKKYPSNQATIARMGLPEQLVIPIKQHVGTEGRLTVRIGEHVLKGQSLTQSDTPFAVPVHAPTSGDIIAIEERVVAHPSGLKELCVVLVPDGKEEWIPLTPLADYTSCNSENLVSAICDAGISGMGGAGFPTHIKSHPSKPIEFLIVNGVECEPYITADDRLMRENPWQIRQGIDVLSHLVQPKVVIIAVEDNKPEAYQALEIACQGKEDYLVVSIPTKYPAGGEKQLIQVLTNREVPNSGLPSDIGILMFNVGTCYAVADAVFQGKPLIERVVTITGDAVAHPQNVWALMGTPVSHLLNHATYNSNKQHAPQVIMGGPMMGFTLNSVDTPVVKITNCLLAPGKNELASQDDERACIRCSECAQACPVSLLPQQMFWHAKAKELEKTEEYNLFDCIECGACAYVCPSEIPLVHYYRQAKSEIRVQRDEKDKAEKAKVRFEARNERLEREKLEREEKHRKAAEARKAAQAQKGNTSDKVAAALERAKAKRAEQANGNSNDESAPQNNVPGANSSKAKVSAAIARAKARKAQKANQENDNSLAEDRQNETAENTTSLVSTNVKDDTQASQSKPDSPQLPVDDSSQKKAQVAAAIARAKAKKAQRQQENMTQQELFGNGDESAKAQASQDKTKPELGELSLQASNVEATVPSESNDKNAKIAAAVARAKARKLREANSPSLEKPSASPDNQASSTSSNDEKQARVAAAVAKAKAKKQEREKMTKSEPSSHVDEDKKAKIAAAIAKAKAKKIAQQNNSDETE